MELYQVRAFVAVARIGSVTKAADALHVTQPAVTAQLKGLEQTLGVALFERSAGRVSLTRAGELLLPKAEALLAGSNDLSSAARALQGTLTGRIEFGVPRESAEFLRLGEMAARVQDALPMVDLRTRSHSCTELLDFVRAGTLTAAYCVAPHPPRDLQWLSLRTVTYRVAIPRALAARMQSPGWRSLAALPWVDGLPGSHSHQLMRALFEPQGATPHVTVQVEDTSALDAYVRAGSGCALLREEVALQGVERQEWVVWGHGGIEAELFLVSTAEATREPLAVALASVMRELWADGPRLAG